MIKSGIKNYLVNLKFFFVPIGALAVGAIIGLSILLPGTVSAVSVFADRVTHILQDASIDFTTVKDFIINSVRELDWHKSILGSIKTMLGREWLTSLFNGCIDLVASDLQPYADQLNDAVNGAVGTVASLFGVFILFTVLGFVGGYFLTAYLVRKNTVKCKTWKYLLAIFIDSVLAPVLIFVCIMLFAFWKPGIIFATLVSVFLFSMTSLLSAYLLHGVKKVRRADVFNASSIFKLFASNFIIFYISVAIVVILCLVINVFSGILIGFSFAVIAFLVISINAESYILGLIDKNAECEKELLAA